MDLLYFSILTRILRSFSSVHLTVFSACLTTMGGRAFSRSASQLWYSLPPDLCNINSISLFKSQLKTLFRLSYCSYSPWVGEPEQIFSQLTWAVDASSIVNACPFIIILVVFYYWFMIIPLFVLLLFKSLFLCILLCILLSSVWWPWVSWMVLLNKMYYYYYYDDYE